MKESVEKAQKAEIERLKMTGELNKHTKRVFQRLFTTTSSNIGSIALLFIVVPYNLKGGLEISNANYNNKTFFN